MSGHLTVFEALFPAGTLGFWLTSLAWTVFFLAVWGVVYGVLKTTWTPTGSASCATWALKLAMLVHHIIVSVASFTVMFQDETTRDLFWCFGCAEAAKNMIISPPFHFATWLPPITIGYMAADLILIKSWMVSKSQTDNYLMIAHHIGSMVVWPLAVTHDCCTRYIVILISTEISSIFLTVKFIFEQTGRKAGLLFKVNGLLFSLSFIVVRVLAAVPQLVAMYNAPPFGLRTWNSAMPDLPNWGRFISLALLIPHVMNFFWGYKVTMGIIAIFRGSRKRPLSEEQQSLIST
mmetsp:Transcript_7421/g.20352  ORF Transcript_7421/g.20352 Transcript_7421/m.20352 type:complete len:291 (-) Transcript_7421:49-921(-)